MPSGAQLRVARIARGLTVNETARAAGITASTLSRIEHGRMPLQPDTEARLMAVVGWTVAFERLFADLTVVEATTPSPPLPVEGGEEEQA